MVPCSHDLSDSRTKKFVEEFIYTKLILAVCLFGIGGNLLNLIILSQKSLVCTLSTTVQTYFHTFIFLATVFKAPWFRAKV